MKIAKIILHDEPSVPEINLKGAAEFINGMFGIRPCLRDSMFCSPDMDTAYEIAATRIRELDVPFQAHEPTREEIKLEMASAGNTARHRNITCYDGFELQSVLGRLVPRQELSEDTLHVIFTDRLTCTYDGTDRRYHGRAVICSNPSVISTTGIVEAPAKPREYYAKLIAHARMGINVDALKEEFRGTFLEYNDARLASIVCGYILQAIFYYETQEPFCTDMDCRLYNAHWQKDLLHSQLAVGRLCQKHQDALDRMTSMPR